MNPASLLVEIASQSKPSFHSKLFVDTLQSVERRQVIDLFNVINKFNE